MEKRIRFGCGFLIGSLAGFFGAARLMYRYRSASVMITAAVIGGLICGWLALRHGDRFWLSLSSWRWW